MDVHTELFKRRRLPRAIEIALRVAGMPFVVFYKILRAIFITVLSRRFIFGVVCLATLVALFIGEENLRGKWAWERCKRELEAHGEHMELAYYIPPQVSDDENFAMCPLFKPMYNYTQDPKTGSITGEYYNGDSHSALWQKLNTISTYGGTSEKADRPKSVSAWQAGGAFDLKLWQYYYRKALPDLKLPGSPEEDVVTALHGMDDIFSELREAEKTRPLSRFGIKYEDGGMAPVPHYTWLIKLEQMLEIRAVAELRLGRTDEAFADAQMAFYLIDATRGDPLIIGALVRSVMTSDAIGIAWEGIKLHRWTDAQLATMETEFSRTNFLSDYKRGLGVEGAMEPQFVMTICKDPNAALGPRLSWMHYRLLRSLNVMKGWVYQYGAYRARKTQGMLSCVDDGGQRVDLEGVKRAEDTAKEMPKPLCYTILQVAMSPYFGSLTIEAESDTILCRFAGMQCYVNEAIIACEVERYRLANGKIPATLADLHMENLPHDVIGGGPLHYRVTGDDYILYSVGWNGKDDGGKVVLTDKGNVDVTKGDWVWSLKPL